MALAVSGMIAAILLAAGFADRDQNGVLTWSGRLWLIFAMAIICGWVAAGWAMWGDPDRLREGEDYWTLAVPIFGISHFVVAFACLLLWWGARRLLGLGWLPALVARPAQQPARVPPGQPGTGAGLSGLPPDGRRATNLFLIAH